MRDKEIMPFYRNIVLLDHVESGPMQNCSRNCLKMLPLLID